MSKHRPNQRPVTPAALTQVEQQAQTLAKLHRLYGRHSLRADAFGRRPALPSEIQRLTSALRKAEERE